MQCACPVLSLSLQIGELVLDLIAEHSGSVLGILSIWFTHTTAWFFVRLSDGKDDACQMFLVSILCNTVKKVRAMAWLLGLAKLFNKHSKSFCEVEAFSSFLPEEMPQRHS